MFDINSVKTRYFELKINEQLTEVEPPTKKMLSNLQQVQKNNDFDLMMVELACALSKNKQGRQFTSASLDEFSIDQIKELIKAYFGWVKDVQSDPNS